jgi:opacity protein-like surface antigen
MACRTYRRTAMLLVALGCLAGRVAPAAAQQSTSSPVVESSLGAEVLAPPVSTTVIDPSVIPPVVATTPTPPGEFLDGAVPVSHNAAVASGDSRRWYIGLNGGWQERETVHEVGDPTTFIIFDSGFLINAQLGYRFDLFRVEAEFSFMNNAVETAGSGGASSASSGNIGLRAYMANIYHDFQISDWLWEPYVGAGIGIYQSEINSMYPDFFGTIPDPFFERVPLNTTSDMPLAYQFRVGASRPVGQRTELLIGYRYFRGEELEFGAAPFATPAAPTFHPDGADIHSLEAGLRVRF